MFPDDHRLPFRQFGDSIPIDPNSGLNSVFEWSNGISPADDSFTITTASPSFIDATLTDDFAPGDEFALRLDGNLVPWSTSGYVGGYFQGFADDIFLSAGLHTFTIDLTAVATDSTSGAAFADFTAVTAAVPEPHTYAMLMAGLFVVALGCRRRRGAGERFVAFS